MFYWPNLICDVVVRIVITLHTNIRCSAVQNIKTFPYTRCSFIDNVLYLYIEEYMAQSIHNQYVCAVPSSSNRWARHTITLLFNCQTKICKLKPIGRKSHRECCYLLYIVDQQVMCGSMKIRKGKPKGNMKTFIAFFWCYYILVHIIQSHTWYTYILAEILSQCHLRLIRDVLVCARVFCLQKLMNDYYTRNEIHRNFKQFRQGQK